MLSIVQTLVSSAISVIDSIQIPTSSGGSVPFLGFMFGVFVVVFSIKHLLP